MSSGSSRTPSGSNNNTLLDQFRPAQNKKRHNKLTNNNINKTNNHNPLDQTAFLLDQTVAIHNATNTKQAKIQQHKQLHSSGSNNTLSGSNRIPSGSNRSYPQSKKTEQPKTQQYKQPYSSESAHTTIWIKQHFFWINTYNHLDQTTNHPNQTPPDKKNRKTLKTKTNTKHFHIPLFYRNFVPRSYEKSVFYWK